MPDIATFAPGTPNSAAANRLLQLRQMRFRGESPAVDGPGEVPPKTDYGDEATLAKKLRRLNPFEQATRESLILGGFATKTVLPFGAAFLPLPLPITLALTLPLPYLCAPIGNHLIKQGERALESPKQLSQLSRLVLAVPHDGLAELAKDPKKLDHLSDEISSLADGALDATFIKHADKKLATLARWVGATPVIAKLGDLAELTGPTRFFKKQLADSAEKQVGRLAGVLKNDKLLAFTENLKDKGRVKKALFNLSERMGGLRMTNLQWGLVTAQAAQAMSEGKPLLAMWRQLTGGLEMLAWKTLEMAAILFKPIPIIGPALYSLLNIAPELNLAWTGKDIVQGFWRDMTHHAG